MGGHKAGGKMRGRTRLLGNHNVLRSTHDFFLGVKEESFIPLFFCQIRIKNTATYLSARE